MSYQPEFPITRLSLLTAQYDTSYEMFRSRLEGLTDEEYFWEPVKNCWNLRRRDEVTTPRFQGTGQWVVEYVVPEPDPPPVTTIAWRLCHLIDNYVQRHNYTFCTKALPPDAVDFPGNAADALTMFDAAAKAWLVGLKSLADAQLEVVGLSSYPGGLDPKLPFGDILWWTNRELIHHAAEISLLRDLWRANH
jgi:DinB superfamily